MGTGLRCDARAIQTKTTGVGLGVVGKGRRGTSQELIFLSWVAKRGWWNNIFERQYEGGNNRLNFELTKSEVPVEQERKCHLNILAYNRILLPD